MTGNPFTALVVERADPDDFTPDDGHVMLSVQPEVTRYADREGRSLVAGFDHDNLDHWHALALDGLDVAGTLARIALDVLPDLQLAAIKHGCDWQPYATSGHDEDAEIRRAGTGYGCHVWLSRYLREGVIDDYELPYLIVSVPRNRERAWRARLQQCLTTLAQGTAASLTICEGDAP